MTRLGLGVVEQEEFDSVSNGNIKTYCLTRYEFHKKMEETLRWNFTELYSCRVVLMGPHQYLFTYFTLHYTNQRPQRM